MSDDNITDFVTVMEMLEQIFPNGVPDLTEKFEPVFPTDIFGAAAYLLHRAGALSHILIGSPLADGDWPEALFPTAISMAVLEDDSGINFQSFIKEKTFQTLGKKWANKPPAPKIVVKLWQNLIDNANEPVFQKVSPGEVFPIWWAYALALLIISDEACEGIGYGVADNPKNWVTKQAFFSYWFENNSAFKAFKARKKVARLFEGLPTLCMLADPEILCVQPKVRTPAVGCTLRGFTHNLSLLPPQGNMRTYWHSPPGLLAPDENASALNLLLVPFPFHVKASWFKQTQTSMPSWALHSSDFFQSPHAREWGWFNIDQVWLEGNIVAFTEALILEAEKDVGHVHGVLFPELALNWRIFDILQRRLMEKFPKLEFIIAGSSSNCVGDDGNFVLCAVFANSNGKSRAKSKPTAFVTSRSKHHRWRLDDQQISNYALGSALDPRIHWWEAIALRARELHVNVFRRASAFTTLICEDLARSDPCHAVLRDLGPNLVFVMLMDGPQLKDRWSARYSTTLADDPGSSVLTFTSLGLVERSNMTGRYGHSRAIALWKDDTGMTVEISCPENAQGVILSLSSSPVTEVTLDERWAHSARAWRFHSQHPVFVRGNKSVQQVVRSITQY